MAILSFPEADTPAELREQVLALQDEVWPPATITRTAGRLSHDPELNPLTMVLVEEGTVLVALDILTKQIEHASCAFRAGGLSSVVTRNGVRGRGHGRELVSAARDEMRDRGLDLAVFTCDRPLRAFYAGCGFDELPGAVLLGGTPAAPFPSDQPGFDKVTMCAFFTTRASNRRSSFENARIALYPGQIDKLW